jgi:hypothetical protein
MTYPRIMPLTRPPVYEPPRWLAARIRLARYAEWLEEGRPA